MISEQDLIASLPTEALHLVSPAALASKLTKGEPPDRRWERGHKHLELLNTAIREGVARGGSRVIINAPPRHGKSLLTTMWTPTWLLAIRPESGIGIACHTFDFAREWGRAIRNTLIEHWPELGVEVSQDSSAAYRWHTAQGGFCVSLGVGQSFIGRGLNLAIVDDPVKDGIEAMNEDTHRRIWGWFRSSIYPRLEPMASVFITQQRWHPSDLSGMLQAAQAAGPEAEGYDEWEVHRFPAMAEGRDPLDRLPGEALWPVRWGLDKLDRIRRAIGPYAWDAQYQQRPTTLGGDILKESWWRYWVPFGHAGRFSPVVLDGQEMRVAEGPQKFDELFQSWDMNFRDSVRAIEKGKEPDPVVGLVLGRKNADLFLIDRFSARIGLEETVHAVREMSQKHDGARTKLVEYTANGPAVIARLRHEVGGFRPVTPIGSKVARVTMAIPMAGASEPDRGARAMSMAASLVGGNLYLPHPSLSPWVAEFRRNLGLFPRQGRDDTDAMSQAWAYSVNPAWREVESAHSRALNEPAPVMDTREEFRQRIRDMIGFDKPKVDNPYRRN